VRRRVRLADGTLAGSTLTMDQALRNFVSLGLPLAEAAERTSAHAAHWPRGRLPGTWPDRGTLALQPGA
jgi:N-acetylglucosamine-6-phosphate deacetylase